MPAESSVDGGRKKNPPKIWGRRSELHRNLRAFVGHLGRTHDPGFHFGLCLGILEGDFGALGETLWKNQHRAAGADCMRRAFQRLRLAFHLNHDSYPEHDTLGAAAFLRRRGPRSNDFLGSGRFDVRLRFHSSSPQKSISGATSSTPYSQPSGRGMPRHTMTAALLVSVARFVSARRCSS